MTQSGGRIFAPIVLGGLYDIQAEAPYFVAAGSSVAMACLYALLQKRMTATAEDKKKKTADGTALL